MLVNHPQGVAETPDQTLNTFGMNLDPICIVKQYLRQGYADIMPFVKILTRCMTLLTCLLEYWFWYTFLATFGDHQVTPYQYDSNYEGNSTTQH